MELEEISNKNSGGSSQTTSQSQGRNTGVSVHTGANNPISAVLSLAQSNICLQWVMAHAGLQLVKVLGRSSY